MAMLSSSSTSPRSSRLTMPSSSLSARSKVKSLMSACRAVGFAVFMVRPSLRRYHQALDVYRRRAAESTEVITALEQGNDPAAGMLPGHLAQLFRRPGEVGLEQAQVGERIGFMRVESGRNQHDVGSEV